MREGQRCLLGADVGELLISEDLPADASEDAEISVMPAAGLQGFTTADGYAIGAALNIGSASEGAGVGVMLLRHGCGFLHG